MGINGVLLYSDEHFAQVLGGSVEAISDLYGKLLRDVRHHNVVRLIGGGASRGAALATGP